MLLTLFLPISVNIAQFEFNPATGRFVYTDTAGALTICQGARDFYYSPATGVRVSATHCDPDAIFKNGFGG